MKNYLQTSYWHYILALLALCIHVQVQAQTYSSSPDLSNLKNSLLEKVKKPVKVNGGASFNTVYTQNQGDGVNNDQPFSWILSGNINLTVLGIALPFNFNYSNKKVSYTNPSLKFNRLALHPKYKAWTAHIGDISSTLTPYTLNGVQYTGGGIEYNKGKWQAQALAGRFLKAVKEDTLNSILPSYRRFGWGAKTVYTDGGKKAALSLFHARDNATSIPLPEKESNLTIKPMEGTAFTLEGAYPLIKALVFNVEYSASILTRDISLSSDTSAGLNTPAKILVLTSNGSTRAYQAVKAGIIYSFGQSGIGINYERVDPGYQTPGGYFFTNDFENMTLNLTQSLWKGKASLSANAGLQRDDLENTKQNNERKLVAACNLNVKPGAKATMNLTYSNMQAYTYVRNGFETVNQLTPYQNLDTLSFTQLSQNANLNISYILAQSKKTAQTLTANCTFMETAKKTGDIIRNGDATRIINGTLSHSLSLPEKSFTLSSSVAINYSYAALTTNYTWGPTINISKALFKKVLNTTYGLAYNSATVTNQKVNVLNIRAGASTVLAKKHNLNMNIIWQNKTGNRISSANYFTATASYAYSF